MNYIGNKELLKKDLTAFLSSDSDDIAVNSKIAEWGKKIASNPKITVYPDFKAPGSACF